MHVSLIDNMPLVLHISVVNDNDNDNGNGNGKDAYQNRTSNWLIVSEEAINMIQIRALHDEMDAANVLEEGLKPACAHAFVFNVCCGMQENCYSSQ